MAQNIIHYSSEALTPANAERCRSPPGFGVHRPGGRALLSDVAPNRVAAAEVGPLREKLDPLKSMTLEEIKRAYQETLRAELPDGSKGAGLGFLTVARDASEPLEFEFAPLEGHDDMMFYLKVTV